MTMDHSETSAPASVEKVTPSFTREEVNRCKRAVVVLAECFKAAMGGKQAPLELREDMLALTKALRRLETLVEGREVQS